MELPTKSYVDSLHESNRNRRDLSSEFYDQDNEFDNSKLINSDSVTVNRNPNIDSELSVKNYVDDTIRESTIVKFNKSPQTFLKVSVGDDVYYFTKYDKGQIADTTIIKYPNTGAYLLQNWVKKCNDKIKNSIKLTKTNTPRGNLRSNKLTSDR